MNYMKDMMQLVSLALQEDIGTGDITTESFVLKNSVKKAHIIAKQKAVVCGVDALRTIFKLVDEGLTVTFDKHDGDNVKPGDVVCNIRGHVHSILRAERVALNYIGYLSGISTTTR